MGTPVFKENFDAANFVRYQSKGICYEELQRLGVVDEILTGESTTWGEYYSGNPGRQPE